MADGAVGRPVQRPRGLLAGYAARPGVPDELLDAEGRPRPGWEGLIAHLDALDPEALRRAIARGEQHLRDAGVFFRPYGDDSAAARDWPFAPVPIILTGAEWEGIVAGLSQRADLLEAVVADLYGPNRLVAGGHIPARLIAENPEWLRPLVGVTPRGGRFLHFVAFDLGRGPDGRWRVLSDRTDAPSGAGFALETRVAASRVFPDLYREGRVQRLAGFFRDFRDALDLLRGASARVGLLTPGPLTDTYYEQAYIARYLGLSLLDGGDLTVEGGALRVRTVRGAAPVDVLWRRMDGVWADPLELRPDSRLGTPGLVNAVRQGRVTMVNALGAGVLETQALMAFLPGICERLTGRPLLLPNVTTWWGGTAEGRVEVAARKAEMTVGPALARGMPFETEAPHAVAGRMMGAEARDIDDWIAEEGPALVGKEMVELSTTPAWINGRLEPRPMTLRVFLARTAEGWQAMPGGFGRVGRSPDPHAIALRQGGSAADVWVLSDRPVEPVTLLSPQGGPSRIEPGALPARAADNLFWLGRYVERTEGIVRLARAWNARQADAAEPALMELIARTLDAYGVEADEPIPAGLRRTLGNAVRSASQIRDRFSVDGWAALTDLQKSMGRLAETAQPGTDAALAQSVLLRKLAGFAGLVHENMYRAQGWRFLSLGRSLERAAMMTDLLVAFADPAAPAGALDLLVEVGDSVMTHRRRYAVMATRESVIDLLGLDEANPRSVRFQVATLAELLDRVEGSALAARAAALDARLALESPLTLAEADLGEVYGEILGLSTAISEAYLR